MAGERERRRRRYGGNGAWRGLGVWCGSWVGILVDRRRLGKIFFLDDSADSGALRRRGPQDVVGDGRGDVALLGWPPVTSNSRRPNQGGTMNGSTQFKAFVQGISKSNRKEEPSNLKYDA